MSIFATEIPISSRIDRGRFAAQAIAWVKGMPTSSLFERDSGLEKFDGEAKVSAPNGESLILRECSLENGFCIGARHEIPDDEGRLWRSEVILTSMAGQSALRARTQCILAKANARVQVPRKPYFLKMVIDDGWAEADGGLLVNAKPKALLFNELDLAGRFILGDFDSFLPVIYVSRSGVGEKGISESKIESISFRLGGIAHVVVEPSREFSKQLQSITVGKNPYGGAIGICIAGVGVARRFLLGHTLSNEDNLIQAVQDFCINYVANRNPKLAWEWQDLLEESNRQFRRKAKSSSEEIDIWNKLRDEENLEKDNLIRLLKEQISELQSLTLSNSIHDRPHLLPPIVSDQIGRELYEDEFSDRVLFILRYILSTKVEIEPRTRYVLSKITSLVRFSGGASSLEDRIKSAGRDSSKADIRLGEVLTNLGFQKRTQGGHPVFTPVDLPGIGQQTLSSSASDQRAGRNAAAQIVRGLAIARLKD